jgi:hypothetical protein
MPLLCFRSDCKFILYHSLIQDNNSDPRSTGAEKKTPGYYVRGFLFCGDEIPKAVK